MDVRVLHRSEHALGRVLVEARVEGRDHPLSGGEHLVRHVDLAVRPDVRLDPLEQPKRREPLVERVELGVLRLHPAFPQVVRVVGHGQVAVATRLGRRRHLLGARLAVRRPGRVRVQVALQVAQLDEVGQLAEARRFELAEVLAQLRRDEVVAEQLVQLSLLGVCQHLARLDNLDAVLGDRVAVPDGVLAQRHVVEL